MEGGREGGRRREEDGGGGRGSYVDSVVEELKRLLHLLLPLVGKVLRSL